MLFPTPDADQKIELSNSDGKTDEGTPLHTTSYSLSGQNGNVAFIVAYIDYPSARDTSAASFDKALTAGFTAAGLVTIPDSFENSALAGLYAREASGTNGTMDAYMRITASGSRVWIALTVFDRNSHGNKADADEFFSTLSRK